MTNTACIALVIHISDEKWSNASPEKTTIPQGQGCLSEILKRTSKVPRSCFVGVAWNVFSPLRGTSSRTTHNLLPYSGLYTFLGTELKTFRGWTPLEVPKPRFLIPLRYDQHPIHFYHGSSPPPPPQGKNMSLPGLTLGAKQMLIWHELEFPLCMLTMVTGRNHTV